MKRPTYVLDSFALLAYFQAEPTGLGVKELLRRASTGDAVALLSGINLGEVVYITARKLGLDVSMEILQDILSLPIQIAEVTMGRIVSAAHFKASHPISYADAFAVGLAKELEATIVTGDPEFKQVESMVSILWL